MNSGINEPGATLSSRTRERQLISMVGVSMPHATQFFMEAKLTFIWASHLSY